MKNKFIKILSLVLVLVLVTVSPSALAEKAAEENVATVQNDKPEATPSDLPDIDINSWEYTLANTYNSVLFHTPPIGGIMDQGFDYRAVESLQAFIYAARTAGYAAYLASGYRNFDYQLNEYLTYMSISGDSAYEAVKVLNGPGTSDHQTGLGACITHNPALYACYSRFDNSDILETELYDWLVEHCHEYGFILRYPEGKEGFYGTPCQAGHFRYVGVEAATYIMENDLCLEEFIMLYDESLVILPPEA